MSESSYKLYCGDKSKNNVTDTVKLYTDLADVQNQGYQFNYGEQILYAKYGDIPDSKASKFRVKINGQAKALLTNAVTTSIYTDNFTTCRQIPTPSYNETKDPTTTRGIGFYNGYNDLVSVTAGSAKMSFYYTPPSSKEAIIAYKLKNLKCASEFKGNLSFTMQNISRNAEISVYANNGNSLWSSSYDNLYDLRGNDNNLTVIEVSIDFTTQYDFITINLGAVGREPSSKVTISNMKLQISYW